MKRLSSILAVGLLMLNSCTTNVSITSKAQDAVLEVPAPAKFNEELLRNRPEAISTVEDDKALTMFCGTDKDIQVPKVGVIGLVAGVFIQPIVNLLIDDIKDNIKKELEKYTSVSSATKHVTFYSKVSPLETEIRCFRFIKVVTKHDIEGNEKLEVVFDFIGQLTLNDNRDAIRLTPVRLYSSEISAETQDGKVGLSVEIIASAVFRDGGIGEKKVVFKETVATASGDLTTGPIIEYFEKSSTYPETKVTHQPYIYVPIIPLSNSNVITPATEVMFTVNVAEAGTKPEWMSDLLAVLDASQDDLSTVLADAIKAKAGLDDN